MNECSRGCGQMGTHTMWRHEERCFFPRTVERLVELGQLDTSQDCWFWHTPAGEIHPRYGDLRDRGMRRAAHRVMFEVANNTELIEDEVVIHVCDRPPCVNPSHLRRGTQVDNIADMNAKGRRRDPDGALIAESNRRRTGWHHTESAKAAISEKRTQYWTRVKSS